MIAPPVTSAPLFSIVVPIYRTRTNYLAAMLNSVRNQDFPDWELICVDDAAGDDVTVTSVLTAAAEADPRIRVVTREVNGGIVAATNDGIDVARGQFIALVDHDDVLAPTALSRVADTISEVPDADVLYTDEAHLGEDNQPVSPFRKPDFSPERLRSHMYIGHLGVYRRSLIEKIGGFRDGYDGSQDYDLALRATEQARRVVHIPQALYYWRIHDESVSHREDNSAVFDAAKRALADHLDRIGMAGTVEQTHPVGVYRVRRPVIGEPLISIVIPTRGGAADVRGRQRVMVTEAVRSVIANSTYTNIEFIVVYDDPTPASVLADLAEIGGDRMHLVRWSAPFNFSAKINRGAVHARGEYLLMLNDDVEVISPDWLETMLSLTQQDGVGMVGPMLYFEDGSIQHGGHVYSGGGPGHIAFGWDAGSTGPFAGLIIDREVSGVTGACAMMPLELFNEIGGMSTTLPVNFNDVDLCLKVTTAGHRILWTPHAELFHFESKTRIAGVVQEELDSLLMRWGSKLEADPYWRYGAGETGQ